MTTWQEAPALSRDSLHTLIDVVFAAPAYRWESRADPLAPIRRLWAALVDWMAELHRDNPAFFDLLTWGLVILLAAILAHAGWVAFRTVRGGGAPQDQVVHVGPPAPRDAAWYAAEVRRLAAAGRYTEAIQVDFLRLMLELDARGIVHFQPSATPIEYVRRAALSESSRADLRTLVGRMYVYAFGGTPCDREAFERWQAQAVANRYAAAH